VFAADQCPGCDLELRKVNMVALLRKQWILKALLSKLKATDFSVSKVYPCQLVDKGFLKKLWCYVSGSETQKVGLIN